MAKKHDENKDLRAFARIGKVTMSDRTLQASKNATIGIHMWGKILNFVLHFLFLVLFLDFLILFLQILLLEVFSFLMDFYLLFLFHRFYP